MKIPVFCSLLPTELLLAKGHEAQFLSAEELALCRSSEYHCAFHENLCSYSKVLYEYLLRHHHEFDRIIIPTSCDALKKLYNALTKDIYTDKLYILDVPQNKGVPAQEFLANQLKRMMEILPTQKNQQSITLPFEGGTIGQGEMDKIGLLGANVPLKVLNDCLHKFHLEAVYINHCLVKAYPDDTLSKAAEAGDFKDYARLFLEKNSCPRTNDYRYKEALVKRIRQEEICGLIINSVKFCDFQHFDYKYFKEQLDIPILLLEHEWEGNYEGQIMTRIEAFFEGMRRKVKVEAKVKEESKPGFYVGIDSGSHATKLVCLNEKGNIVSKQLAPTGTSVKKSVAAVLRDLAQEGITREKITRLVATGYGRNNVEDADQIVTEISCHAAGAYHMLKRAGTIIDIGGQDSKAIRIDENGKVMQFAMNDKCAAGTGRFLEVMAHKLEMPLEEFARLALEAAQSVPVSSMCSVFAESEVISLIAGGHGKQEIAKGIHKAIADRTAALTRRVNGTPPYYMAGGVSKNIGLIKELEESLHAKITIMEEPQFTGALGAALFAWRGV